MENRNLPKSAHYEFQDLGEGIYAAIARPEGYAICNSGLVALGPAPLVFDTGLTPGSAQDLRKATEQLFGHPPSMVANSHWHLDHSLGNPAFAPVPVWGTRRTREILLEQKSALEAQLTREAVETDLKALEARRSEMSMPGAIADLEFNLQIYHGLLSSLGRLEIDPPAQTFDTRLALPGNRGAELASFGSGHTEADAVLLLLSQGVLFAGDLVVTGIQPSLGSSDPTHWLEVLDVIERLGAERLVPGHGPVSGLEAVEETRRYLAGVLEAAGSPSSDPLPATLRRWEGSVSLDENLRFARKWIAGPRGS